MLLCMGKEKISIATIDKIKLLREQGYSIIEISQITKVSKTTVFRYIQNVKILPEFLENWLGKRGGSKKVMLQKQAIAIEEAKKIIVNISKKEKLLFLSALYWAEGSKKDFGLSNTDPELIKVFVNGLREIFNISDERFRVSIRIYEDLDKEQCLDYWSEIVNISKDKFVNVNILKGKKVGKLQYGMCRVRVTKGGDILKKIYAINKRIAHTFVPIA